MNYSELIKKAANISYTAHKDDYDKAGYPYFMHPLTVAFNFNDEEAICVALLHDVIEDHKDKYSFEYLKEEGFTEKIIEALKLLTHDPNVPYLDYVKAIKENDIARRVKIADLKHNLDLRRNNNTKPKKYDIYLEALKMLEN